MKITHKLKKCPCGKTPRELLFGQEKALFVRGSCCQTWENGIYIEKPNYKNIYGKSYQNLVEKRWNSARGKSTPNAKIEKLIEQLSIDITKEQDKRTSKATFATVTTLRYSIECLKQLIKPEGE